MELLKARYLLNSEYTKQLALSIGSVKSYILGSKLMNPNLTKIFYYFITEILHFNIDLGSDVSLNAS